MFSEVFDLTQATPGNDPEIITGLHDNEAFLTQISGKAYAVYYPRKGSANIVLPSTGARYTVQWLNIDTSSWQEKTKASGRELVLSPPAGGQWLALITVGE